MGLPLTFGRRFPASFVWLCAGLLLLAHSASALQVEPSLPRGSADGGDFDATGAEGKAPADEGHIVLARNDLETHCYHGNDYSIFSTLPPFDTLTAQLVNHALATDASLTDCRTASAVPAAPAFETMGIPITNAGRKTGCRECYDQPEKDPRKETGARPPRKGKGYFSKLSSEVSNVLSVVGGGLKALVRALPGR